MHSLPSFPTTLAQSPNPQCYGLNCVPTKFICSSPNPQCDCILRYSSLEVIRLKESIGIGSESNSIGGLLRRGGDPCLTLDPAMHTP